MTTPNAKPSAGEHAAHDDKMLIFALREENDRLIDALVKIAELGGDCEQQHFKLTRFQASQVARAAINGR